MRRAVPARTFGRLTPAAIAHLSVKCNPHTAYESQEPFPSAENIVWSSAAPQWLRINRFSGTSPKVPDGTGVGLGDD